MTDRDCASGGHFVELASGTVDAPATVDVDARGSETSSGYGVEDATSSTTLGRASFSVGEIEG